MIECSEPYLYEHADVPKLLRPRLQYTRGNGDNCKLVLLNCTTVSGN
jgi:hypothetical protein